MTRDQLVNAANVATSVLLVRKRKISPTLRLKAERAAFQAILSADRTVGTPGHPFAQHSHHVSALAEEGVSQAISQWQKVQEVGASGVRQKHVDALNAAVPAGAIRPSLGSQPAGAVVRGERALSVRAERTPSVAEWDAAERRALRRHPACSLCGDPTHRLPQCPSAGRNGDV